ncbi:hypothetical protein MASR2M117_07750 [Paludibacter sp.]
MRKLIIKVLIVFIAAFFTACVGELPQEQFDKYVLLTRNGWVEQDVEFTPNNIVEIPLSVFISGTSGNNKNVDVQLIYDVDVLARYNLEKYKLQDGLYYTAIPESAVTFSKSLTIPSGKDVGIVTVTIDFNQITDPYKDYVLPISIESTNHYSLQEILKSEVLKRSEGLYHIRRINSFSGNYSGSATVFLTEAASPPPPGVKYKKKTNGKNSSGQDIIVDGTPVPSKTLYAISDNECYFYAGQIDRNNINRDNYIVNVRVNENDSLIFSSPNVNLQINANAAIIKGAVQSTITTTRKPVPTDSRYEMVTKVFTFCYTFYDLNDSSPVTPANNHILLAEGTLSRERKELKSN